MRDRNPVRVLLVDDHRAVLIGLSTLIDGEFPRLQVAGAAATGAEALRLANETHPDVILLDVDLGDENGLDLMPELTRDGAAKVVILTSVRDPMLRTRAQQLGAHGFVSKDEPATAIFAAIDVAMLGAGQGGVGGLSQVHGSTFPEKEGASSDLPSPQRD
jgi:DNA-binding NarL/FixJ family response regulator